MDFMKSVEKTLNTSEYNQSITENGALGFEHSKSKLVDINFKIPSLREMSDDEVIQEFDKAFFENPELAIKWVFYLRDVHGGIGERKTFRIIMNHLLSTHSHDAKFMGIIWMIPEYGRWDDVLDILYSSYENDAVVSSIVSIISTQISEDVNNYNDGKSVSLLAKWMPSVNSKNSVTRKHGQMVAKLLYPGIPNDNTRERVYRKLMSKLRERIDIVERKMCSNSWDKISYEAVPSKANLIYKDAFMRHDADRREEYLDKLTSGETKINSGVCFPHEIVHKYDQSGLYVADTTYEAMWKSLPNTLSEKSGDVLVVRDGSGSMSWGSIPGSNVPALTVSTALAIYFAERSTGRFHDKFITFSSNPKIIQINSNDTLANNLLRVYKEDDCSNTNIEKVFKLILDTAVKENMEQKDIPSTVLVLSDMEFNPYSHNCEANLFESINKDYEAKGYKLPKLVFWNLNSRTNTIPLTENDEGVILLSGFSVNLIKMVMSNKLDPYEALVDILESDRYKPINDFI